MIVAVTGGSGFLGRYVVAELERHGHVPVVLSRDATPDRRTGEWRRTDYGADSLSEVLQGVDRVIHLAAVRGGTPDVSTYLPGVVLTEALLQACAAAGVEGVVHASTISVYSGDQDIPWDEQTVPAPLTAYGMAKLMAEHLCRRASARHGLSTTNLRLAHLFGFAERNDYLVNRFLRAADAGEELVLHAPGRARREFQYAADAARALVLALDRTAGSATYNAGSGEALTNEDVAAAINAAFDQPGRHRVLDPEGDEGIDASLMDSAAARRDLGYEPVYDFTAAAREIREMARGERDVPPWW